MAPLKPCVEWITDEGGKRRPCGDLSPNSRCPEHARAYEKKRFEKEPWRHLYDDPRYSKARTECFAQDGWRCTYQVGTRRCNTTVPLQCHHEEKLRAIWERCGSPQRGQSGWDHFVNEACDKRKLRTLCTEHHKLVDNNNPDEVWLGKPGERATSQHRRMHRSGKRRSSRHRNRREAGKRPTRGELRDIDDKDEV